MPRRLYVIAIIFNVFTMRDLKCYVLCGSCPCSLACRFYPTVFMLPDVWPRAHPSQVARVYIEFLKISVYGDRSRIFTHGAIAALRHQTTCGHFVFASIYCAIITIATLRVWKHCKHVFFSTDLCAVPQSPRWWLKFECHCHERISSQDRVVLKGYVFIRGA